MLKFICAVITLNLYTSICLSQQLTTSSLIGSWTIFDTLIVHKNFRVTLTFHDSNFICEINGRSIMDLSYKIENINDSTFIDLKKRENDWTISMKHLVILRNDTLMIYKLWLPNRPEYNFSGGKIFFIRNKIDSNKQAAPASTSRLQ